MINSLTVLETRSLQSKCQQGWVLLETPWKRAFPASSSFWWLLHFWLVAVSPQSPPPLSYSFLLCVWHLLSLCLSLLRTLVLACRAHRANVFMSRSLVNCTCKNLTVWAITYRSQVSGCEHSFGATISPPQQGKQRDPNPQLVTVARAEPWSLDFRVCYSSHYFTKQALVRKPSHHKMTVMQQRRRRSEARICPIRTEDSVVI